MDVTMKRVMIGLRITYRESNIAIRNSSMSHGSSWTSTTGHPESPYVSPDPSGCGNENISLKTRDSRQSMPLYARKYVRLARSTIFPSSNQTSEDCLSTCGSSSSMSSDAIVSPRDQRRETVREVESGRGGRSERGASARTPRRGSWWRPRGNLPVIEALHGYIRES